MLVPSFKHRELGHVTPEMANSRGWRSLDVRSPSAMTCEWTAASLSPDRRRIDASECGVNVSTNVHYFTIASSRVSARSDTYLVQCLCVLVLCPTPGRSRAPSLGGVSPPWLLSNESTHEPHSPYRL